MKRNLLKTRKFYFLWFLSFYSLLFIVNSCDSITESDIDKIIIPSSNVSYIEYIQPVFNVKCTGCHDGQNPETNLDLTSWAGVRSDASIVVPYYPENSKLIWSIEGIYGYLPMPPINAPVKPLTENQIQGIKTWIKEGAEYN